jgi:protein brassinosteroid insensitive 2
LPQSHTMHRRRRPAYTIERMIAAGSAGVVFEAISVHTSKTVAIKRLRLSPSAEREVELLKSLSHPNILQFFSSFLSKSSSTGIIYLNIVTEYVPQSLSQVISHFVSSGHRVPMVLVKCYLYQLLSGLSHVHSHNVIHRDIKPDNLLVNPSGHELKLSDFGSAKLLSSGPIGVCYIGARYYRAPELIFGSTVYTASVDMWSVGCVAAELLLGEALFPGESAVDQLVEIIKVLGTPSREQVAEMNPRFAEFRFPELKSKRFESVFPEYVEPHAVGFVSQLLVFSTGRPTAREMMQHPLFDEIKEEWSRLPNGQRIRTL